MNYRCYATPEDSRAHKSMMTISALGWECSRHGWDELPNGRQPPNSRRPRFELDNLDPSRPNEWIGGRSALRRHLLERAGTEMGSLRKAGGLRHGSVLNPDRAAEWLTRGRKVAGADITAALQAVPGLGLQMVGLDKYFWLLTADDWQEIIDETKVDQVRYVAERSDCDNYAIAFAGIAALRYGSNSAGIAVDFLGKHAYNVIPVDTGDGIEIRIFEPQTDQWRTGRLGTAPYEGSRGYIVFG